MPKEQRVALVTGASRGIGAATAERLRADGWGVETAERGTGVDLADFDAARAAVERLERIDGLVANAGTTARVGVLDTTLDDWQRVIDLNLSSVFVLAQAAARRMVEQRSGSIVLLASMLSFTGGFNVAAYAASKGGVAQLAKALSNELAGHGVRVNAIAPGYVETEMTASLEEWRRAGDRRAHPDGPLRSTGRDRRRDRIPPLRRRSLRDGRRDPGRRRVQRALTPADEPSRSRSAVAISSGEGGHPGCADRPAGRPRRAPRAPPRRRGARSRGHSRRAQRRAAARAWPRRRCGEARACAS